MKVRVPRLLLFPSFRNVSESLSRSPLNLSTINTPERPGDKYYPVLVGLIEAKKNCKQPSQARSRNSLSLDFPSLAGGAFEPAERLEQFGKVPLHLGARVEDGLLWKLRPSQRKAGSPAEPSAATWRSLVAVKPPCTRRWTRWTLSLPVQKVQRVQRSRQRPRLEPCSHTQPYAAIRSHAPPCALRRAPFEAARAGDPAGTTASPSACWLSRALFLNSVYLALPSTSM